MLNFPLSVYSLIVYPFVNSSITPSLSQDVNEHSTVPRSVLKCVSSPRSALCTGDPILSHLERHTAESALRLHAGADEREHVRALLHTVCVAGGGRRPELQPRLQHLQGNAAGRLHPRRIAQRWHRTPLVSYTRRSAPPKRASPKISPRRAVGNESSETRDFNLNPFQLTH